MSVLVFPQSFRINHRVAQGWLMADGVLREEKRENRKEGLE
jgi:hypothetical protein